MNNTIKIAKYEIAKYEITKTDIQRSTTKSFASIAHAQMYLKDMKERALKRNFSISKSTKNNLLIDLRQSGSKMWLFTVRKRISAYSRDKGGMCIETGYEDDPNANEYVG